MFKKTAVCRGIMLAMAALTAQQVLAQAAPQRIEVTGSSIRRTDTESAPIQIITKAEIEQSGKGTVAEYLQTLTADGQGSVPFTYGRGFSGATSAGISLRGLGANATLVLVNGRRVAPAVLADDAQRSYVDLNQIPFEAVERVEVLKDGASSIYGSDAVAGVVNIILRKNYVGTVAKVSYGIAQEGDGNEPRAAITHGFGDLSKDGFNVLLNGEIGKKDPIYLRDRKGRNAVGVSASGRYPWGFDPNVGSNNIARTGGNGWIPVDAAGVRVSNSTTPSIVGNVRYPFGSTDPTSPNFDPLALNYYSRSDATGARFGAAGVAAAAGANALCRANANLPQDNPAGGCIIDQRQAVNQIQPEQETLSLYGRFTKSLGTDLEAFAEVGYYSAKTTVDGLAPVPSGGFFTPAGVIVPQAAVTLLGAAHPDNPYLGTAARLSYLPLYDIGVSSTKSKSNSMRLAVGLKGTMFGTWDFDTGFTYSEAKQTDTSRKLINWRVKNALLNPTAANVAAAAAFSPAYAALPANTVWRIAENAGLNSAAMYDALLDDKERKGDSSQYGADFKVTTELGKLPGGGIGLALGAEIRHEENSLPFYDGLGDYIGLSLTAYGGKRDIFATYGEVLLPVLKNLEVTGALRYDNYSDAGNSTTPKLGVKWKAVDGFALRGTLSKGFRAPSSTENSPTSIAAFGGPTVNDTVRCNALRDAGLAPAVYEPVCQDLALTFVQRGNPDLKPEKSTSRSFGLVWDITPKTSLAADMWQIKRTGLPVTEDAQAAIDAGRYTRDTSSPLAAGDPGAILSGFVVFQNSAQSITRGFDVDIKHRWDVGGGMGKVTWGLNWSHLLKQQVIDSQGVIFDYAGTHGNCDITNCIGSPKDKVGFSSTWDVGQWRVGANVNYRGSMSNKLEQKDTTCAQTLLNGADFPAGCLLESFTTVDISGALKVGKNIEVSGSIANLLDAKPPADFETYGAIGYNPTDFSGAIGRYFRVTVKYTF